MEGHATTRAFAAVVVVAVLGVPTAAGASHGTPEDQTIAQAGVLKLPDFPAGWQEDLGQNHLSAFLESAKGVKQCKAFQAMRRVGNTSPNAQSSDYTSSGMIASNDVTTVPSITLANDTMAAYKEATTGQCLGKVLPTIVKRDLARTAKVGPVKTQLVNALTPTIPGGDATAGYRILMKTTVDGTPTNVYVENWLNQIGRTMTSYDFERRGELFAAEVAANASAATAARVASAATGAPVAGQSAYLARFLPTVPGYTYEQPPAEEIQQDAALAAANPALLNGVSGHAVYDKHHNLVAALILAEYREDVAALPGFSSPTGGVAASDATDLAKTENGGTDKTTVTSVNGTPVHTVPVAEAWSWRIFQCGRVEFLVEGFEEQGTPAAATDAFVERLIRTAC